MINKKAAVPIGQIRGAITALITFTIAILLFYGCQVNLEKDKQGKNKFSISEIEAAKSLNLFLDFPVDGGQKVSDFIQELYLSNSFEGIKRKNILKLDKIIKDFISDTGISANIILSDRDNLDIYNSRTYGEGDYSDGKIIAISQSKIAVSLEEDNPEFIQILFELIK